MKKTLFSLLIIGLFSSAYAMMGVPAYVQAYEKLPVASKAPLTEQDIQRYLKVPFKYGMLRHFPKNEHKRLFRTGFKKAHEKIDRYPSLEAYVKAAVTASGIKEGLDKHAQRRGFQDAVSYLVTLRRIEAARNALDAKHQLAHDKNDPSTVKWLKETIAIAPKQDIDFVERYYDRIKLVHDMMRSLK